MKRIQQSSLPLAIILGTLLLPLAQASSPPPLKPNEKVVTTRDGCGFVVDESKPSAKYEAERITKLTWGGPCVNGLAMGEGWIFEGSYQYIDIHPAKGWRWYGRAIGAAETKFGTGEISHSFTWEDKTVTYNTLSTDSPVWNADRANAYKSSRVSDGNILVYTFSKPCILETEKFPECKGDNKFDIPGVRVHDRQTRKGEFYLCPNPRSTQGCEALWAQHAGPVIERITAFITGNTPKVAAAKREVAPLIAKWRPSPTAARDDAARHAAIRAEHLVERKQREEKMTELTRETERLKRETERIQAESERQRAIAAQERKERNRRDRQEAMGVLRSYADTSAAMGNRKPTRQLAAVEILAGNSPQEILSTLRAALADAIARSPAIASRLSNLSLPRNISAQDALALLRPALMDVASRKPDVAKKLAILEALTASSPDEAMGIMKPMLNDAVNRRLVR